MTFLSVGYVSGLIAVGVHVIEFLIPDAVALILAGMTSDEQSTIAWSVVGRTLHNSHWPTILRSDASAAGEGIRKSVQFAALLRPTGLLLVTVAAIVTPLGLYEITTPDKNPVNVSFRYVNDKSPLGLGTPPRPSSGFSRLCRDPHHCASPGSPVDIPDSSNETSASSETFDTNVVNVPGNTTTFFQSGLEIQPASISSVFDIQWRSYTTAIDKNINNGTRHVLGAYRQLTSMVLNNAVEAFEGLIVVRAMPFFWLQVSKSIHLLHLILTPDLMSLTANVQDSVDGGIGFRNHTVPKGLSHGAIWSEDLLFIEPETVCVDTNVTLNFYISDDPLEFDVSKTLVLTDRGGFAELNRIYPEYDRNDTQANPDLWGRAYQAAWMNNAMTMVYLNITRPNPGAFSYLNSEVGQKFPIGDGYSSIAYDALKIERHFGNYLNLPTTYLNGTIMPKAPLREDTPVWENPYNITLNNFSDIVFSCNGAAREDKANISNTAVGCGLVQGAARLENGQDSLIFDRGSNWTIPLYSCASATKALIKTANFRFDGGQSLKGLTVTNVTNKAYDADIFKPLWAVENTDMELTSGAPLWGLVSDAAQGHEGYAYVRSDHLYLPGLPLNGLGSVGIQNLAGTDFHSQALSSAYDIGSNPSGVQDYSGKANFAMFVRWQELSRLPQTTAKIVNLVWTDLASNAVIGTRSWLTRKPDPLAPKHGSSSDIANEDLHSAKRDLTKRRTHSAVFEDSSSASVPVTVYSRRIRYHWPFAIPAFLVCLVTGLMFAVAILFALFGRIRRLRQYIFQLSAGRLMGNLIYLDECSSLVPTKIWRRGVGVKRVKVGVYAPEARDHVLFPKQSSSVQGAQESLMAGDFMDGKGEGVIGTRPVDSGALTPGLSPYAYTATEYVPDEYHDGHHGASEDYRM